MGFALSWIAVKGKPAAEVLRVLALRPTGGRAHEGDVPFVAAESDAGWYLVVMSGAEHRLLGPAVLTGVSAGCELLTCTVEEHVMFSEAAGWKNGERAWKVTHRGEDGPIRVDEDGTLPPGYNSIRDRLMAMQEAEGGARAEVDHLFDIPVVLAQSIVGYKHDEVSSPFGAGGFEVLEPEGDAAAGSRSWLGRLVGRRRDG